VVLHVKHAGFDGCDPRCIRRRVDRTGLVSVPNTGGWQPWQTVTKTGLSLTAGPHVIRLVFETGTMENGGVGNYNWVRVGGN
jgi:hypothetical protein